MANQDMELLREYAAHGSEAAFETLVNRYVNLVYSAALRRVGDPHLAEEVSQVVFVILARKAGSLGPGTVLPSWLHRTACFVAADALRTQFRRTKREQDACMQSQLNDPQSDTTESWRQIAPLLDNAISNLGEKDRQAVILRFFESKSFGAVGQAIGSDENTARMRVSRALEKLRRFFAKRSVTLSAIAIGAAISANSVHAAPPALAKTITTVAIAKGAASGASTLALIKGTLKLMAWTKAKTAVVAGVAVLLAAGTTPFAYKTISHHREDAVWSHITGLDMSQLIAAPPAISIRPSRFNPNQPGVAAGENGKMLGVSLPFNMLLSAAFDTRPCRIAAKTPLPTGTFDFIISQGDPPKDALPSLIQKKFGLTTRLENYGTNALILTVQRNNAPALKPTAAKGLRKSIDIGHLTLTQASMSDLASDLELYLGIPVIDQTAVTGKYDIDIRWKDKLKKGADGQPQFTNPDGLKQAVLDQLGLQLTPSVEPVEMLVVEHAR